ncbi:MAG: DUF3007 family protein [Symploca sp. SIO1A3]|nr:DUF3007 family protein [Symploca sp. SIO2C1]NER45531.1 DUF3007 family protein [Symploca sp. SIO1A3]
MRRIDAIAITLGAFAFGGVTYIVLQIAGVDGQQAGIWTQLLLVVGLLGWVGTYLFRVANKNMTYNQQLKDYEEAVMEKKLESMTPEQLAQLQAEIEQEKRSEATEHSQIDNG